MSVDCTLYKNSADNRVVDKTPYLEEVTTLVGSFRDDVSIVHPTIRVHALNTELPGFNYVKIDELDRYYYVTGIRYVANCMWEVDLECDVLMTYKFAIGNCYGFIERNENLSNPNIIDTQIVMESGQEIQDVTLTPVDNILGNTPLAGKQQAFFVLDVYCGYGV